MCVDDDRTITLLQGTVHWAMLTVNYRQPSSVNICFYINRYAHYVQE